MDEGPVTDEEREACGKAAHLASAEYLGSSQAEAEESWLEMPEGQREEWRVIAAAAVVAHELFPRTEPL